jgi:hypothetical protein
VAVEVTPLLVFALFFPASRAPARSAAVTFDDLPAVAVVGDGTAAQRQLNDRRRRSSCWKKRT